MAFVLDSRGRLPHVFLADPNRSENSALLCDQVQYSLARQLHHALELRVVEGNLLGGGLHFDHLPRAGHHEIHIDFGARVFVIGKIEENFSVDDAHAGGCNKVAKGN